MGKFVGSRIWVSWERIFQPVVATESWEEITRKRTDKTSQKDFFSLYPSASMCVKVDPDLDYCPPQRPPPYQPPGNVAHSASAPPASEPTTPHRVERRCDGREEDPDSSSSLLHPLDLGSPPHTRTGTAYGGSSTAQCFEVSCPAHSTVHNLQMVKVSGPEGPILVHDIRESMTENDMRKTMPHLPNSADSGSKFANALKGVLKGR